MKSHRVTGQLVQPKKRLPGNQLCFYPLFFADTATVILLSVKVWFIYVFLMFLAQMNKRSQV